MVDIQAAGPSDTEQLVALWHEAGLAHPWNDSKRDIDLALAHPSNIILLARTADQAVVGSVMVGYDGHRGWIYSLGVANSHRRTGLGRQLIEHAENWLRERKAPVVRLLMMSSNTSAASFYESCGYERGDFIAFGKKLA
jgi:ribosomal protein S18 acetylase RimI-like enzyme